jgi:hypothetical protein
MLRFMDPKRKSHSFLRCCSTTCRYYRVVPFIMIRIAITEAAYALIERVDHSHRGVGAMTRLVVLALALAAAPASAMPRLTCEVSGAGKAAHCFDHHGYLSTEERSGDYVHGHDNQGHAWTEWRRGNRTYLWPDPDRQ